MAKLYRRNDSPYLWCWGYDAEGRVWKESTKQRTEKRAIKAAERIERRRFLATRSPAISLVEALEELRLAKVRKGVADATLQKLRDKGRRLLTHFGPRVNVCALRLADIEAYTDARLGDEVSRHTIAMEVGTLLEALRMLKRHGRYDAEPKALFPDALRDAYTPGERWLTIEEYRKVWLAMVPSRRDHFAAYCYLGLRHSELYKLRGDGVRVTTREVWAPGTKTKKSPRWLPIHDDLWPVIEARLGRYGDGPLFPDRWGKGVINRTMTAACDRAKVPRVTTNDLRRTFASWLCNAGVPEIQAARLMGHGSSQMLRRVYAQLSASTLRGAIDAMPSRTKSVPGQGPKQGKTGTPGKANRRKNAGESDS